jgi:hypothetical protein
MNGLTRPTYPPHSSMPSNQFNQQIYPTNQPIFPPTQQYPHNSSPTPPLPPTNIYNAKANPTPPPAPTNLYNPLSVKYV